MVTFAPHDYELGDVGRGRSATLDLNKPRFVLDSSATGVPVLSVRDSATNLQDRLIHQVTEQPLREYRGELGVPMGFETLKQRAKSRSSVTGLRASVRASMTSTRGSLFDLPQPTTAVVDGEDGGLEDQDVHSVPWPTLCNRLEIERVVPNEVKDLQGLAVHEAARRLARDGRNVLTPPKQRPEWLKFLIKFSDPFMILLEVAAVLCFIGYALDSAAGLSNLILGFVLLGIVTFTCALAYFQEGKNSAVAATFAKMLPSSARVRRGGVDTRVTADTLVIGDLVTVESGEKCPADIRMILVNGLKVDNSSLTGESEPITVVNSHTHELLIESRNMAFSGSLVVEGEATGIVVAIGDNTLIGSIATLASSGGDQPTTLQIEVKRFVHFITILAVTMGLVFFVAAVIRGLTSHGNLKTTIINALINAIGIIVANVPEGLPACVTGCLTISSLKLAERNVNCKKLESVETLGSCTVIASDKTGTLTQNVMSVAHFWYNQAIKSVDASIPAGTFDMRDPTFIELFRCAICCNRAFFDGGDLDDHGKPIPIAKRQIRGDATESAFLRFCHAQSDSNEMRARYEKIMEIKFNSTNKWQLSIHRPAVDAEDQRRIILQKGAAERIIANCSYYLEDGEVREITDEFRESFEAAYEKLGGMGERVLGFCMHWLDVDEFPASRDGDYNPEEPNFPTKGLTFLGLISLIDPPREAVPEAIASCHTAGIKVIMVTGDHPLTAVAIARKINILSDDALDNFGTCPLDVQLDPGRRNIGAVVASGDITNLQPEQWDALLSRKEIVLARASPENKLQLVLNLQRRGEIVAVTGDGVNDSPALKQANIGIAMGIVGSDVSKEAADVILMDDNFASIVNGIQEGRRIFDCLKKSIAYTLSHLVPEIVPFALNIVLGYPLALTPFLILCIDLITEMPPSISFAYELAESDIMNRPPRDAKVHRLVDFRVAFYAYLQAGMIEAAACLVTFYIYMGTQGFTIHELSNVPATDFQLGDVQHVNCTANPTPCIMDHSGVLRDPVYQKTVIETAASLWFLSMVFLQMANTFACRTRVSSIFTHGVKNMHMNLSLIASPAIMLFIVYVPFIHGALNTHEVYGTSILPLLPFIAWIVVYSELRKIFTRKGMLGALSW